jgi:hypothetical protein
MVGSKKQFHPRYLHLRVKDLRQVYLHVGQTLVYYGQIIYEPTCILQFEVYAENLSSSPGTPIFFSMHFSQRKQERKIGMPEDEATETPANYNLEIYTSLQRIDRSYSRI